MPNVVAAIAETSHEIQIPTDNINHSFLASELSIEKKKNILDRQQIASQWGLQLIFRMHNSDPTPQGYYTAIILIQSKTIWL
jgi:hypothetical protein